MAHPSNVLDPPAPAPAPPPPPEAAADRPAPEPTDREVENLTARRIGIEVHGTENVFVVPPFGKRRVSAATFESLNLERWICSGLVRTDDPKVRRGFEEAGAGLLVWAVIIAGVDLLANRRQGGSLWFWLAIAAALGVLTGIVTYGAQRTRKATSRAIGRLYRWLGIASVSAIGFGVPALMILVQDVSLDGPYSRHRLSILGVFVAYVGILATLPAMLYYLFDQQQKSTVREEFFRQVMRLSPAVQSLNDAERAHGAAVDEVYGERKPGMLLNLSALPLMISTLLLTLGWAAALMPNLKPSALDGTLDEPLALTLFLSPEKSAFTFAFLGAYFFTLNMVFRRYVRADLSPKAYSHISIRIIIATVLAWVASAIPSLAGSEPEQTAWALLVAAFFIGVVPETGMALFHDILVSQQKWIGAVFPSIKERDPLSNLQGITLYDRARLLEEGIENIENLAHHDLIELMLRTRIPPPRLVDLVDQAILYLHAREADVGEGDVQILAKLRRVGIRTASDLELAAEGAKKNGIEGALFDLLGSEGSVPRLQTILQVLADDEWMIHIRHWRHYLKTYDKVYCFDSFFSHSVVGAPS